MSEIKGEWKLPKNIRQIGEGGSGSVIYVEDYVITFLEEISAGEHRKNAILLGTVRQNEQRKYIFIDGALETDQAALNTAEKEKYFGEKSVVGWFLSSEESPFVMRREILETFQKEYAPEEQVLVVRDIQEEETAVFLLENEQPVRQTGYYIYYEKNVPMREYMIAKKGGKSVEEEQPVKDDAIKRFRKIVKKKNEQKEEQEKKKWHFPSVGRLSYLVGGALTVTILALGVTMIYNYDRMKEVERNLAMLTNNIDSQSQYLNQDNTAQVMLHLEEEMTDVDIIEETETAAQTEEAAVQQGESMQAEELLTTESGQEEKTLQGQDLGQEAAETILEQNSQSSSDSSAEAQNTAQETKSDREQEAKETAVSGTTAGRASYTVRAGDTLAGISEMYYGNLDKVEEICSLNGIDDENTILPGQKILLP